MAPWLTTSIWLDGQRDTAMETSSDHDIMKGIEECPVHISSLEKFALGGMSLFGEVFLAIVAIS